MTGSNIPTAEETGPNPVDTYRPADIEKLGIRNTTDLTTFLPQEAGGTVSLNIGNGGDGTVQFNLRGLLPKETLVLVDGKRVAYGSLGVAGASQAVDINLLPFVMIDHIDILKDGASAVYGSDAIAGVVNFFLIHKFRGLEIGGSYGNTNLGASNDMGEWEAWLKAGTGDDKTDIVVIADVHVDGSARLLWQKSCQVRYIANPQFFEVRRTVRIHWIGARLFRCRNVRTGDNNLHYCSDTPVSLPRCGHSVLAK